MEVVLGNLVDLGLRDLFGDALAGGEGVSRGDSCGERSELMSMAVSEEKAQGIRISELYIFVELNRSKCRPLLIRGLHAHVMKEIWCGLESAGYYRL